MNERLFYTIVDTCSALDGLDVQGSINSFGLFSVSRIRDRSKVIGDRHFSTSVNDNSLFIDPDCLVECKFDENMEFAHDNPYGKHKYDAEIKNASVYVVYQVFEKGISINIFEKQDNGTKKYHFSHSFFDKARDQALQIIKKDDLDVESLTFLLSDLIQRKDQQ